MKMSSYFYFVGEPRLYNQSNANDLKGIGNGKNLDTSVQFVANPAPIFTWGFRRNESENYVVLNDISNFKVSNFHEHVVYTSQATRTNMREQDFGQYIIQAQNGVGKNASFVISVIPISK